ncbi:MAG: acyl-CoA dehydrogenase family protein [Parachlamydiales bacterium]|jgi:alkylation response protein AidB-like acyl-CoA dehydrogenase
MDEEHKRLVEELLFSEEKAPSFAKRLYFGSFYADAVLPYPEVSPQDKNEVDEYVARVEAFANEHINASSIDRNSNIPADVIKGLGDLGVLGMTIPKRYGGLGMSQYAYCRVCEVLARRCGATALFVNAHQSVGLKALLLFGNEEQKERWLPPLARGEAIAAFSLTEPNAGSDAAGIETKAEWIADKGVWRITGRKQWTTNGSIAAMLTVMAKTKIITPDGPRDKITAFIVTPDMPGFSVTAHALEKVGMRGSKTANLAFDGVEVPKENVLGPMGGGLRVCLTVLDYGRTTFGATCTGSAYTASNLALEHAKTRYQFNKPLAAFPLVKKKIAQNAALLFAMDATTYLTASLVDKGIEDIMLESSLLKVFASEASWKIIYESMQIFGGRSFFTDLPLERMMRDARLNMIGEGANEVLRAFIGAVGMRDVGMDLQKAVKCLGSPIENRNILFGAFKQLLKRASTPFVNIKAPELQDEKNALSKAVRSFGWKVLGLLKKYREEIVDKQFELDRVATQAIAIYTTTAALGKADKTRKPKDIALAKYYASYALELGAGSGDEATEKLSDMLTGIKQ